MRRRKTERKEIKIERQKERKKDSERKQEIRKEIRENENQLIMYFGDKTSKNFKKSTKS